MRTGSVFVKISKESVKYIAQLARIDLTEEETDKMSKDMEVVLSYMDKLNELDTCDVKPAEHIIQVNNVLRDDKTIVSSCKDELLSNAPSKEKGYFKVPGTF